MEEASAAVEAQALAAVVSAIRVVAEVVAAIGLDTSTTEATTTQASSSSQIVMAIDITATETIARIGAVLTGDVEPERNAKSAVMQEIA